MRKSKNRVIVILVLGAVAALFIAKQSRKGTHPSAQGIPPVWIASEESSLPLLLELGADKCVPCKMMAPILEDIKTTCTDQLRVEFVDVWKHPEAAATFGVRVIPVQLFFNEKGEELFRHEGFFAKEDILLKWKELGYEFP